jgi:excisionase family DNA binding protein
MDLLTQEEAAEVMGCTKRTIQNLTKSGQLRIAAGDGFKLKRLYHRTEVEALREAREGSFDLAHANAIAHQAWAMARQNERMIKKLFDFLGFNVPRLKMRDRDIISLYAQMEEMLGNTLDLDPTEVQSWAEVFYAMKEEYFQRVMEVTDDDEPWRIPLELVRRMCKEAPARKFSADKELASAYGYLDVARRALRSVSYFYVRALHGKKVAEQVVPNAADEHEQVLLLAFM